MGSIPALNNIDDTPSEEVFYTLDDHGYIQSVNIYTGEVTQLEGSLTVPQTSLDVSKLRKVVSEAGDVVYVQNNISKEDLAKIQGTRITLPYSPILADQICERIANGETLVGISKGKSMPSYAQIARWRREHPEFDDMYKLARRDRSEVFFAKMLGEVESALADRDEISLARLRADIYKFAAKVSSPDEYAEKTTIDARVAVGEFTIETGVRREGDPGFNRDETKTIREGLEVAATAVLAPGSLDTTTEGGSNG